MKTLNKRKRESKTDYGRRTGMLKSEKPRIVFRKTNKYILSQYVESEAAQDKVILETKSKELLKNGWPENFKGSLKSIPASYLTGLLMAKKIGDKKLKTPIIDFGMIRTLHKNSLFAFLKGLKDNGLNIECKEEAFPEEERIQGKNLKQDFSKEFNEIKKKIIGVKNE